MKKTILKPILGIAAFTFVLGSCQMSAEDCACDARAMMEEAMALGEDEEDKMTALQSKFDKHIEKCEELFTAEELQEAGASCD